jgi:aspartate/methionine/tyrosine aminotransferase
MKAWQDFSKEELMVQRGELLKKYNDIKDLGLSLNMSRGKPSPDVLDLSNRLLTGIDNYYTEDGADVRNYGILDGIPELKRLFSELLDIPESRMVIGGNSSLSHMYNIYTILHLFGAPGFEPWSKLPKVKFLCPVPGYDRHFAISEDVGTEMISVPMTEDGPNMDMVEELVRNDSSIKGIWCVPLYSNPQGIVYSDETVARLAKMETAAGDFRIFWDNAYGIHHIYDEYKVADIMKLASEAGYSDRVYYFFSTSKVTFPGGGIGLFASGEANVKQMRAHISKQTIGYYKIAQLKFMDVFGTIDKIKSHMQDISKILKPKFDLVLGELEKEFNGTGLITWIKPKGGYFISVDTLDGCADRVVAMAKDAGAVLTGAGATFPNNKDPRNRNIRIAPTYPDLKELKTTMELLCVCIKLASIDKLLDA